MRTLWANAGRGELHPTSHLEDGPRRVDKGVWGAVLDGTPVAALSASDQLRGAPIPVTKDHPLYQFMRDGDGDGRVCE